MSVRTAEERKEHNRQQLVLVTRWSATVLAVPALVVALVAGLLLRNVLVAVLVALVVYAALASFVYIQTRAFGATLLARFPLAPADEHTYARLHNLTDGLAVSNGLAKPQLLILATDARNAFTVLTGDRERDRATALVITSGLLEGLSRIELEGLLAQQLAHLRDGDTALATLVAALAAVPAVGPFLGRRAAASLDPTVETAADLAGSGMTRYPPGLASALRRLTGQVTVVPGVDTTWAHLWLADPLPAAGGYLTHPPLVDRIEVLREL